MFDVVAYGGAFSEPVTRFYFKRFLEALQYIHEKGFAHRDIKIENVIMDSNYELKINDFGFTIPIEGRDGSGVLRTKLGTTQNMAPEFHKKDGTGSRPKYSGSAVDIFASSTLLFTMLSMHPPFLVAHKSDNWYKYFIKNDTARFWAKHEKTHPAGLYTREFKDLFNAMV